MLLIQDYDRGLYAKEREISTREQELYDREMTIDQRQRDMEVGEGILREREQALENDERLVIHPPSPSPFFSTNLSYLCLYSVL